MVRKFRVLLSVVLVLALFLMLAACGENSVKDEKTGQADTSTAQKTEVAKEDGPVVLTVVFPQGGTRDFNDVIDNKFTAENPDITVEKIVAPGDYVTYIKTRLATDNAPDVAFENVGAFTSTYRPDDIIDLSGEPWISRLVNPEGAKVDGVIKALPRYSAGEPLGMVYNKEIFQKNNITVPKSYQEFLNVCETLKSKGINPVCMTNKDAWNTQLWPLTGFPEYLKGTDVMDKINSNQMKHSEVKGFETVLGQLKEIVDKGYCNKDHLSVGFDSAANILGEGKAAMGCYFASLAGDIAKKYPQMEGKFGFFATPAKDDPDMTAGATNCYVIFKESKHQEAAKKYLQFWSSDWAYNQVYAVVPGFMAMNDSTFKLGTLQQEILDTYIKTGKMVKQYNDQIKVSAEQLNLYEQDMVAGGKTPHEVLEAWDKEFANLMKAKKIAGF